MLREWLRRRSSDTFDCGPAWSIPCSARWGCWRSTYRRTWRWDPSERKKWPPPGKPSSRRLTSSLCFPSGCLSCSCPRRSWAGLLQRPLIGNFVVRVWGSTCCRWWSRGILWKIRDRRWACWPGLPRISPHRAPDFWPFCEPWCSRAGMRWCGSVMREGPLLSLCGELWVIFGLAGLWRDGGFGGIFALYVIFAASSRSWGRLACCQN